ncbi:UDP-N-acetylmuramoyl-tripeptide--D-alanyl-D-alanine ligase [Lentibacillus cibarius]|uniref:UDP-N-acetylmuramoyl-tripeptide--D-alanyl-D-alanine ligase n=1 Tax=Lentibacillus cibarius TaxID=2583219 RepID=A0A549YK98_9BACI|nr:UDP-N-acetylmuramoyl-tripeptide--D-alanyl-D-alanine ligase [Lentibacillus cibarius]TRM12308.1 UDP-N-acetylmuramoyl-tripeptide--D-alanyl-D-alanine ligase [Lentibacillus cibarius]
MLFTTEWLTTIFPDYRGAANERIAINEVATDSRKTMHHSLFVPLIGEKFDGHNHIQEAIKQGAAAALWDAGKELPAFLPEDFPLFIVRDTLQALQTLAAAYRKKINPTVIGVTGSNGKTTTKDMIASVAASSFRTHHTKGNLNNQIGVPLTILSMPVETEVLVVEMGMNHAGEINVLSEIARPDYGVITNIGESHIEYLGSREAIASAKLEITKGMPKDGCLIIDGDEALLRQASTCDCVITCGFDASNDVAINNVNLTNNHTAFQLNNDEQLYTIPLLGSHHALNAAFAVTVAELLNIKKRDAKQALASLEWTSMRFELLTGRNGSSVINDAYNASPTSMKAAINVVKQMEGFKRKVLVLGDMFELGEHAETLHRSVAASIDQSFDAVFTLGKHAAEITLAVNTEDKIDSRHFTSRETLLRAVEAYTKEGTLILFKASRGMQFESLLDQVMKPST